MPRRTGHYDREWPHSYLQQQFSAMRWLAEQGFTPVEIREFRWGMVDEGDRTITVRPMIRHIHYDRDHQSIITDTIDREPIKIPIKGTGHEWFFLRSNYKCPWMFTAHEPKTWRKQGSKEALFPLSDVEKICAKVEQINNSSLLTELDKFARIDISKLNITKMKTEELVEKAVVVS